MCKADVCKHWSSAARRLKGLSSVFKGDDVRIRRPTAAAGGKPTDKGLLRHGYYSIIIGVYEELHPHNTATHVVPTYTYNNNMIRTPLLLCIIIFRWNAFDRQLADIIIVSSKRHFKEWSVLKVVTTRIMYSNIYIYANAPFMSIFIILNPYKSLAISACVFDVQGATYRKYPH